MQINTQTSIIYIITISSFLVKFNKGGFHIVYNISIDTEQWQTEFTMVYVVLYNECKLISSRYSNI
jgi:hypothetical protein